MIPDCDARLTITGPEQDRQRLLRDLVCSDSRGEEVAIDFAKLLPPPPDLPGAASRKRWLAENWGAQDTPPSDVNIVWFSDAPDETVILLSTFERPPRAVIEAAAARFRNWRSRSPTTLAVGDRP